MKKMFYLLLLTISLTTLSACEITVSKDNPETLTSLTPRTDALLLTEDYVNKSFLEDGIGEVILYRCVDGDTARFMDKGSQTHYSVRFIGIDTPETGRNPDPWAYAAASFTCDKLSNAKVIVLESEPSSPQFDMYGRYLAYVWYDGRLLNLELVELSYAPAMGMPDKYGLEIVNAWFEAIATKKRIHGELDPNYDYGE